MESTNSGPERFLSAHRFSRQQRLYFLLWNCTPILVTVVWFGLFPRLTAVDAVVFFGMLSLTLGLGMTVGYHRYFTHRSFEACRLLQIAMAAIGGMTAQGPISYWVALHRCHHQFSDEEHDPHSPQCSADGSGYFSRIRAFLHGHVGWVICHDVPNPRYFARDLTENTIVRFFDKTHQAWVFAGILIPGFLMLLDDQTFLGFMQGCIIGGTARIVVSNQLVWAVNSFGHTIGRHSFKTHDRSTNSFALALLTYGEGWHNNHHAFPWSARLGLRWWQIDFGWWIIGVLRALRLVSHVKQPSYKQMASEE